MYQVTTKQSDAITQALREAETKIEAILQQPCGVLLTTPRIERGDDSLNDYVTTVLAVIRTHTGVTTEELQSKSRSEAVTRARNIAVKIIRESHFKPALAKVANYFNRDHSTAINSIKVLANDVETSSVVRQLYNTINNEINKP